MEKITNWIKSLSTKDKVMYSVVSILLVVVACYAFKGSERNEVKEETKVVTEENTSVTKPTTKTVAVAPKGPSKNVMNRCNFRVTSPEMYSGVTVPFTVTGILDKADKSKGCDWNENALRAGEAELFYNRNGEGWKSVGTSVPIVTRVVPGNATTTLAFSVSFNLYAQSYGLKSGTPIKIVFTELNIPVQTNPDIFDFQVYLK